MIARKSNQAFDFMAERCRQHNLKVTPQRMLIYRELIHAEDHPGADQIYQRVRKRFPNISFDTVNRTLMTFVGIGLIDPVEGYGRSRRFDACLETHHHVHCVRCHKIVDFQNSVYDALDIPAEIQERFTVLNKKVVINVMCDTCRREADYE